jgi:hypothetical protein
MLQKSRGSNRKISLNSGTACQYDPVSFEVN